MPKNVCYSLDVKAVLKNKNRIFTIADIRIKTYMMIFNNLPDKHLPPCRSYSTLLKNKFRMILFII